jgi:transcriptional regulator GlxA family with amidase domain
MDRKRVGIVVFAEIEVLDFCGPFEVFSTTRLNEERLREEASPFEVLLISQSGQPIKTTGGMKVIPDASFDRCPVSIFWLCLAAGALERRWVTRPCSASFGRALLRFRHWLLFAQER